MATKFDSRQVVSLDALNQLTGNVADIELDNILRSADSELSPILQLSTDSVRTISISSPVKLNPETARYTSLGPINGALSGFVNGTIQFPDNAFANAWETGPAGPGSSAFAGGVLLPNGKVFAIPFNYTGDQTIYNPATNAWETGPAGPGSGAFAGGVLLPNGKVFAVPFNYTGTNTIYNPATNAWETGPAGPGSSAFAGGGVLLPNGKVFAIPTNYTGTNTIYNPATNAWETGPAGPGGNAFYGGVLLPNGKVFAIPFNYTGDQTIYNPATNAWETGPAAVSGLNKFYGGVLLPNGKVFAIPFSYTGTDTIYNPATNAWETGPAGPGSSAFAGGVLLPNGKVFAIPYNYLDDQTIYNPATNAWETGPAGPDAFAFWGGVLLPNGKVFAIPYGYTGDQTIYSSIANIVATPGNPQALLMSASSFMKIGIHLEDSGNLLVSFGTESGTVNGTGTPPALPNSVAIGYAVISSDSDGIISNISTSDVYQYVNAHESFGVSSFQDRNIKMTGGGTWTWDNSNLTLNASAYMQIPGLGNTSNEITAQSITLNTDEVAYVTLNRSTNTPTVLPVYTANISAVPQDNDNIIIARRDGADILVGTSSFRLKQGERLELDGALAELTRRLDQLKLVRDPLNADQINIGGVDIVQLDGATLSQELNNILMNFTGATVNFSTGVVSGDANGNNFTPFSVPAGEYFWYGIAIVGDEVGLDDRISARIQITPATASDATQANAKLPRIIGAKKLGAVQVWNNGGTIEVVDIKRLGVGSGSGGESNTLINSNTTLDRNSYQRVVTDSSGGAFTVNLPGSPLSGDIVKIQDGTASWETFNVTVGRNGNLIETIAIDDILDLNRGWIEYEYYDTIQGWIVRV